MATTAWVASFDKRRQHVKLGYLGPMEYWTACSQNLNLNQRDAPQSAPYESRNNLGAPATAPSSIRGQLKGEGGRLVGV